jgi:hypothetical protein
MTDQADASPREISAPSSSAVTPSSTIKIEEEARAENLTDERRNLDCASNTAFEEFPEAGRLREQGDTLGARKILREVMRRCKGTSAAVEAKKLLDEMGEER